MTATLEKQEGIQHHLKISIPALEIAQAFDKKLAEATKRARLPGFRPGKVPLPVLKKQFGKSIRAELMGKLIEKHYLAALETYQLKPAGFPKLDVLHDQEGEDYLFSAILETLPDFEVQGIQAIEIEKLNVSITDAELDAMVDNLRKQHVKWQEVQREAQLEDRVIVDFEGFIDAVPFEGGSAKDVRLVLGSKRMIEGFETGLLGAKAGAQVELNLTFPADYQATQLKGKPALFKVTVKEVAEPHLPPLDDAFAKLFAVDTVADLREEVKNNMARELEFNLKGKLKQQVMTGLLKHNAITLPEALIREEAEQLKKNYLQNLKVAMTDQQKQALPWTLFKEEASRRVCLALIMDRLIKTQSIKLDASRFEDLVNKMASVYEDPEEAVDFFKHDKKQRHELEQLTLEDQVVDYVLSQAHVTETVKSFSEVMPSHMALPA